MQNSINSYIQYFRTIATKHASIAHDPNMEGPQATEKGKSHFVLFDTDEVVTGLRSLIGPGFILFLEVYNTRVKDNHGGDYRSIQQGRFIIARKVTANDIFDYANALASCEQIAWDIINKMICDSRNGQGDTCNCPFSQLYLDSFNMEVVTNLWEGRSGWVVEFAFQWNRINEIDPDLLTNPDVWIP